MLFEQILEQLVRIVPSPKVLLDQQRTQPEGLEQPYNWHMSNCLSTRSTRTGGRSYLPPVLTTLDEEEDCERARQRTAGAGRSLLRSSWALLRWPAAEARRARGFSGTAAGGAQERPWLEMAAPPMLAAATKILRGSRGGACARRANGISRGRARRIGQSRVFYDR